MSEQDTHTHTHTHTLPVAHTTLSLYDLGHERDPGRAEIVPWNSLSWQENFTVILKGGGLTCWGGLLKLGP